MYVERLKYIFLLVFNINLTNCVNFHLVMQQPLALSQKATN